jgi:predicted PurR-regulated permease PerM
MRVPTHRTELIVPYRTILVLAGVFFIGWAIASVREALLLVFTGVFIGLVAEFPVRALERRFGLGRGLAATITVLTAIIAVTALALLLLVPMVEAVRDFLQDLPATVQELQDRAGAAGDSGAAGHVQDGSQNLADQIPDAVSAVLGVAGQAFSVAIAAFTITFTALFFLTDVGNLRRATGSVMTPEQETRWMAVWERVTETVSRWAIGVVVIATIAGTVQGTTAWLLGSSYALALGVIAGLLDMIPNLGATIAGFILSLTLLAEQGVTQALIMLAVVLVYQQVENSVLTPTIQGKATNISGLFVITGVTVFGALLGVLGALVAVPITATIQIIVQEVTAARRERMAALRTAAAAIAAPAGAEPAAPAGAGGDGGP